MVNFASYKPVGELAHIIKWHIWEHGGKGFLCTRSNNTTQLPWFSNYDKNLNPYKLENFSPQKKFFYSLRTEETTEELLIELQKIGVIPFSLFDHNGLYYLSDRTYDPYRYGVFYTTPPQ